MFQKLETLHDSISKLTIQKLERALYSKAEIENIQVGKLENNAIKVEITGFCKGVFL